jgi:hypothetical protein
MAAIEMIRHPDACSTETGQSLSRDGLFNSMRGFNKPIGHRNTAAVTLSAGVFNLAGAFNQPLHWDVGAAEKRSGPCSVAAARSTRI